MEGCYGHAGEWHVSLLPTFPGADFSYMALTVKKPGDWNPCVCPGGKGNRRNVEISLYFMAPAQGQIPEVQTGDEKSGCDLLVKPQHGAI